MSTPDELVPPENLDYGTGLHHFREVGETYFRYCIDPDLGRLTADGAVLDVGCGFGRVAVPLLRYLSPQGRYEGFDVAEAGVRWSREHITPRNPKFRFQIFDVANESYRIDGAESATSFEFPYAAGIFDLVVLRSVFTHMPPEEVDHYLGEIARVMRPGARCLISYFLLNKESLRLLQGPRATRRFSNRVGKAMREWNNGICTIAYDESFILSLYQKHKFTISGDVRYGAWCGRDVFLDSQDLIVAIRERAE